MSNGDQRKKIRKRTKRNVSVASEVQRGEANVFADLRVPRPAEMLARAELARQIADIVQKQRLTQAAAARILCIDQPKVSALLRGHLKGFSADRLFRFLNALGADVDIVVRSHDRMSRAARTRVVLGS